MNDTNKDTLADKAIAAGATPAPPGDGWVDADPGTKWEWEQPGQVLTGILMRKGTAQVGGRNVGEYVINVGGNNQVVLLGTVLLDRSMERVPFGNEVWIRFDSEEDTGQQNPMRRFTVKHRARNRR